MAQTPTVLSHWHKLLEGLQASPLNFYESVEEAMERREIPDTSRDRVDFHEGGALSARREYLRVRRGRYVFDICGAPFGTGFFVSWWFGELRSGPLKLALIAFALLMAMGFAFRIGFFLGVLFFFFGIPAILWLLVRHTPEEFAGWDDPIRSIPFFGPLYERWVRPDTYYTTDTYLMFQSAVHAAVLDVVDELTKAKGVRALSELERKPVHQEFAHR